MDWNAIIASVDWTTVLVGALGFIGIVFTQRQANRLAREQAASDLAREKRDAEREDLRWARASKKERADRLFDHKREAYVAFNEAFQLNDGELRRYLNAYSKDEEEKARYLGRDVTEYLAPMNTATALVRLYGSPECKALAVTAATALFRSVFNQHGDETRDREKDEARLAFEAAARSDLGVD